MGNASNKVLNRLVGNVLALQVTKSRKELNATQRAVMVRLQNAVAIEESIAALNSAESK